MTARTHSKSITLTTMCCLLMMLVLACDKTRTSWLSHDQSISSIDGGDEAHRKIIRTDQSPVPITITALSFEDMDIKYRSNFLERYKSLPLIIPFNLISLEDDQDLLEFCKEQFLKLSPNDTYEEEAYINFIRHFAPRCLVSDFDPKTTPQSAIGNRSLIRVAPMSKLIQEAVEYGSDDVQAPEFSEDTIERFGSHGRAVTDSPWLGKVADSIHIYQQSHEMPSYAGQCAVDRFWGYCFNSRNAIVYRYQNVAGIQIDIADPQRNLAIVVVLSIVPAYDDQSFKLQPIYTHIIGLPENSLGTISLSIRLEAQGSDSGFVPARILLGKERFIIMCGTSSPNQYVLEKSSMSSGWISNVPVSYIPELDMPLGSGSIAVSVSAEFATFP